MSLAKFISLFAGAGFFIPIAFRLLWMWLEFSRAASVSAEYFISRLMLMFWPSSIMNLGAVYEEGLFGPIFLISLAANVFLYMVVGLFVWYGLRQHRLLLLILFVAIIMLWWRMLTL